MRRDDIARQLRHRGHDVLAVVEQPGLAGEPDDALLAWATSAGRRLVTRNIRDFAALDAAWHARGRVHSEIV